MALESHCKPVERRSPPRTTRGSSEEPESLYGPARAISERFPFRNCLWSLTRHFSGYLPWPRRPKKISLCQTTALVVDGHSLYSACQHIASATRGKPTQLHQPLRESWLTQTRS